MMVNGVDTDRPQRDARLDDVRLLPADQPPVDHVGTGTPAINDLIVSTVVPPNSIQPIDATTSPLSIVNGSFGFDQSTCRSS